MGKATVSTQSNTHRVQNVCLPLGELCFEDSEATLGVTGGVGAVGFGLNVNRHVLDVLVGGLQCDVDATMLWCTGWRPAAAHDAWHASTGYRHQGALRGRTVFGGGIAEGQRGEMGQQSCIHTWSTSATDTLMSFLTAHTHIGDVAPCTLHARKHHCIGQPLHLVVDVVQDFVLRGFQGVRRVRDQLWRSPSRISQAWVCKSAQHAAVQQAASFQNNPPSPGLVRLGPPGLVPWALHRAEPVHREASMGS